MFWVLSNLFAVFHCFQIILKVFIFSSTKVENISDLVEAFKILSVKFKKKRRKDCKIEVVALNSAKIESLSIVFFLFKNEIKCLIVWKSPLHLQKTMKLSSKDLKSIETFIKTGFAKPLSYKKFPFWYSSQFHSQSPLLITLGRLVNGLDYSVSLQSLWGGKVFSSVLVLFPFSSVPLLVMRSES